MLNLSERFWMLEEVKFSEQVKVFGAGDLNLLVIPKFVLDLSLPNLDLKILMHSTDVDAKSEPSVSDVEGG